MSETRPGHLAEQPDRMERHVNAAEYWLQQADLYNFPDPARTECLQLAATHASLAQALTGTDGPTGLHTYTVMRTRIKPGWPLTFSDGERIVTVLRSDVVHGGVSESDQMDIVALVELPAPEDTRESCRFWDVRAGECRYEMLFLGCSPCASCPGCEI